MMMIERLASLLCHQQTLKTHPIPETQARSIPRRFVAKYPLSLDSPQYQSVYLEACPLYWHPDYDNQETRSQNIMMYIDIGSIYDGFESS